MSQKVNTKILIQQAIIGNQNAGTKLYKYYSKFVENIIMKQFRIKFHDMEDLKQQVFMKLFDNLNTLKNEKVIKSWLRTTTRNVCFTFFRDKKRKAEVLIDNDGIVIDSNSNDNFYVFQNFKKRTKSPDRIMFYSEVKEYVEYYINRLTPKQQEILRSYYWEGLTYQEIADKTGLANGTVGKHISDNKRKLKKRLDRKGFRGYLNGG